MDNNLFKDIGHTEYTVDACGIKVPYSDFDRPDGYYDRFRDRNFSADEYIQMCKFKDKSTALFDKRWQSARAVVDLIAREVGIDPDDTDKYIYALTQDGDGSFSSPLVDAMRFWFDKSGDKVKLKKQIKDLESQLDALRAAIGGSFNG